MTTVPPEARRRADLLLLLGPGAGDAAWIGPIFAVPPTLGDARRDVIWLCGDDAPAPQLALGGGTLTRIGATPDDLGCFLGLIRAGIGARRVTLPFAGLDSAGLAALVARLAAAHFGVAAFDPADLDALAIENLYGLVKDLNAATRFSVLRRPSPDEAAAANEVCTWTTGGPVRVGFGRGVPEHDSWRFDASRLVESGEADAALWISALRPEPPGWTKPIPTVALLAPANGGGAATASGTATAGGAATAGGTATASSAFAVRIEVGVPGLDHDAVLTGPRSGALAFVPAAARSNRPSAADILARIEARLSC